MRIFVYGNSNTLKNYKRAIIKIGALPIITTKLQHANNCDALLLAGGGDLFPCFYGEKDEFCKNKDFNRDLAEFSLISQFLSKNAPIVGICRGLQILNVFFGGNLNQKIENFSLHYNSGNDVYHDLTAIKNSCFNPIFNKLKKVNSAHRQSVKRLATCFETIAVSNDLTIEAIMHKKAKIYAFQFHPERLSPPLDYLGIELLKTCFYTFN